MQIRPYEAKDKNNVRIVGVNTGGHLTTERDKRALWYLFLDYYIEVEPDCCFVAADEEDNAVGFIIAAADYKQYEKAYRELYLSKLGKQKFLYGIYKNIELVLCRKFGRKYPAHLHIDINPEYQRLGLGHKLMDALILRLNEKNVKSVYLIVGNKNEKGKNFYKKYGFDKVGTFFNGIVFALDVKTKAKMLART